MKGKFITLEGIDGAGKSTHHRWLVEHLRRHGREVVATREPGGTSLAERLRELLLHETMHPETETLLMFAARREHLDKVIVPALVRGEWVVCDRFTDATFAYQGGGRRVDRDKLAILEAWVQGGLQPDLTLFFDLPTEVAQARLAAGGNAPDRFEQERQDFFERVRQAYLDRAVREPRRIAVIDAAQSVADIEKSVEEIISTIC